MIHGLVVIDKPAGMTSHDVVSRVRRIMGTRKVGHTGTLDPFATGVLPVAINEGTKTIPFLDEGIKCYEAVVHLGVTTDTLDRTGQVVMESDCSSVDRDRFLDIMALFQGEIEQIPPMFSALKKNGQPLYKLARQGIQIERQPRKITIYSLELLDFQPPLVSLRIVCSRGTYIRTLADDMGAALGCGAMLDELRRIASGPFDLSSAVSLDVLETAVSTGTHRSLFLSPLQALHQFPRIELRLPAVSRVRNGAAPDRSDERDFCCSPVSSGLVCLTSGDSLVAVAEMDLGRTSGQEIILKRVFTQS